ncbi:MAG: cytochrome c oxidase accessory protein CcoG [Sandaracinaceae bacterium]|nr:cytochrome c oxidase accessory protein CcoG [Sandaracinaceae bacterium]MDW8246121.1 cytochrome c oxidase accessory protein CcoG [Sandaracinaceae bacterium]
MQSSKEKSLDDLKLRLAVYDRPSSLRKDGRRVFVHPADVSGRFTRLRHILFYILIAIWAVLPWIHVGGRPAVFLDVPRRRFFFFGYSFDATSFWLVWFVLTGVLFGLVFMTAILGRAWCGYACPQTVFLEGVYRKIERWVEGNRNERIALDQAPMSWDKLWRRLVKHFLYILVSLFISHMFVAYFVSMPSLLEMMTRPPWEHPYAFAWCFGVGAILYGNFAWFREQLCLVICPYGRLQSILLDDDSLVVGYDEKRGEPRKKGKPKEGEVRGDCIDCGRCVAVCPTGIDIRNGLQVDCIACAQCIDACDEVMKKIGKQPGLVRYDSLRGLRGEVRRFFRPRIAFYVLIGILLYGSGFALCLSQPRVEARIVRLRGLPFFVEGNTVRNAFEVHLINDSDWKRTFRIHAAVNGGEGSVRIGDEETAVKLVELDGWKDGRVTVVVRTPLEKERAGKELKVKVEADGDQKILSAPLLGPNN